MQAVQVRVSRSKMRPALMMLAYLGVCIPIAIGPVLPIDQASIAYATGTTYYVSPLGSNGNDCMTSSAPCATINVAVAKALSGDTIMIAPGIYYGGVGISANIALQGAGPGQTIIDGSTAVAGTAVSVGSGTIATIAGITIQNGHWSTYTGSPNTGGGIINRGSLTLTDSEVISNTQNGGGGIANQGTMTLTNSIVSDNSVTVGGNGSAIAIPAGAGF